MRQKATIFISLSVQGACATLLVQWEITLHKKVNNWPSSRHYLHNVLKVISRLEAEGLPGLHSTTEYEGHLNDNKIHDHTDHSKENEPRSTVDAERRVVNF